MALLVKYLPESAYFSKKFIIFAPQYYRQNIL